VDVEEQYTLRGKWQIIIDCQYAMKAQDKVHNHGYKALVEKAKKKKIKAFCKKHNTNASQRGGNGTVPKWLEGLVIRHQTGGERSRLNQKMPGSDKVILSTRKEKVQRTAVFQFRGVCLH